MFARLMLMYLLGQTLLARRHRWVSCRWSCYYRRHYLRCDEDAKRS